MVVMEGTKTKRERGKEKRRNQQKRKKRGGTGRRQGETERVKQAHFCLSIKESEEDTMETVARASTHTKHAFHTNTHLY